MISFRCPECAQELEADDDSHGKQVSCPACSALIEVPFALAAARAEGPRKGTRGVGQSEEESIYQDQNVRVTSARIIIGSTTYALRNITSVSPTVTYPSNNAEVVVLVFGILGVLLGISSFSTEAAIAVGVLLLSAVGLAWAVWSLRHHRPTFHVTISSTAGEKHALSSYDKGYILKIVGAINDAIARGA